VGATAVDAAVPNAGADDNADPKLKPDTAKNINITSKDKFDFNISTGHVSNYEISRQTLPLYYFTILCFMDDNIKSQLQPYSAALIYKSHILTITTHLTALILENQVEPVREKN